MDPFRKHCLVEGKDEVDITLLSADAIRTYEERQSMLQPWVARGTGLAA
jgi:3-isopropylmalate dehydratase small subunit